RPFPGLGPRAAPKKICPRWRGRRRYGVDEPGRRRGREPARAGPGHPASRTTRTFARTRRRTMAWYEDLQSHFDFADFSSWCHNNNERQAARMANVWGMITAVHGDHVFNHVAAMQATSRQAKIVELVMSCTGGTHPLLANQSDLLDTAGRRLGSSLGGRSDQDYQNAADRVQAWGVNLEAVLLELVPLRDGGMGPEIERAYAAYLRDLQGRREEALGDERPKKTAKRLRKLRKHQRMKLDGSLLGARGGHDRGRFWLLTRAVDNRPILLVSDGIV